MYLNLEVMLWNVEAMGSQGVLAYSLLLKVD